MSVQNFHNHYVGVTGLFDKVNYVTYSFIHTILATVIGASTHYYNISLCHVFINIGTVTCTPLIRRVLVWMVGFISSWLHTHS
jgi:hypothetical protein